MALFFTVMDKNSGMGRMEYCGYTEKQVERNFDVMLSQMILIRTVIFLEMSASLAIFALGQMLWHVQG